MERQDRESNLDEKFTLLQYFPPDEETRKDVPAEITQHASERGSPPVLRTVPTEGRACEYSQREAWYPHL